MAVAMLKHRLSIDTDDILLQTNKGERGASAPHAVNLLPIVGAVGYDYGPTVTPGSSRLA